MKRKSILFICTIMLVLLLNVGSATAEQKNITVFLNNEEQIYFDVNPVVEDGRTLVPIKAVAEAMGFSVEWEATEKKVYCVGEVMYCTELTIGSKEARRYQLVPDETNLEQKYSQMGVYGDITKVPMDVAAKVISGRTMVPLRFLSEAFGGEVQWDGVLSKINIVTDTENSEAYMEISEPPAKQEPPKPIVTYKVGDYVELIDWAAVFLGQVKAVKGDKLEVYWYDVTDWYGRPIGHSYAQGQCGGMLGEARFQQNTWLNRESVTKAED